MRPELEDLSYQTREPSTKAEPQRGGGGWGAGGAGGGGTAAGGPGYRRAQAMERALYPCWLFAGTRATPSCEAFEQ